jgi:hypothetical protein
MILIGVAKKAVRRGGEMGNQIGVFPGIVKPIAGYPVWMKRQDKKSIGESTSATRESGPRSGVSPQRWTAPSLPSDTPRPP